MLNALSYDGNVTLIVELADVSSSMGQTQVLEAHQTLSAHRSQLRVEEVLVNPWRHAEAAIRRNSTPACIDHAAPLSPLRDRDLVALDEFFDRGDLIDLEQDLNRHLLRLFPEPCWEDGFSSLRNCF